MKQFYKFLFTSLLTLSILFCIAYDAISQLDWTKYEANPVFKAESGGWDDINVGCPSVIFKDDVFHMWYAGNINSEKERIGYATSQDGILWVRHQGNPVIDVGSSGSWDSAWVSVPSIIFDGQLFHMWYVGDNGTFNWNVGYATSPDGIAWTKYDGNPVLTSGSSGSWESIAVSEPKVILVDSTFHMWYAGISSYTDRWLIGYATSKDGTNWIKHADNPVINWGSGEAWDKTGIEPSCVMFQDSTFKMWYSGTMGHPDWKIGYAESENGIDWNKDDGNPLLSKGESGTWDSMHAAFCSVIFVENTYRMWYTGLADGEFAIGLASSPVTKVENITKKLDNYCLYDNYPNPFNSSTTIKFAIPKSEQVLIEVYNALGQKIETLLDTQMPIGNHEIIFDAKNLPSGIYIHRMSAGDFISQKKCLFLK